MDYREYKVPLRVGGRWGPEKGREEKKGKPNYCPATKGLRSKGKKRSSRGKKGPL